VCYTLLGIFSCEVFELFYQLPLFHSDGYSTLELFYQLPLFHSDGYSTHDIN